MVSLSHASRKNYSLLHVPPMKKPATKEELIDVKENIVCDQLHINSLYSAVDGSCKMRRELLLFMLACIITQSSSEIFSAIEDLKSLAEYHEKIIGEFEILANKVESKYINEKLELWQNELKLVNRNVMIYITNPLNAYLLIKRLTSEIELIQDRYPNESQNFIRNISGFLPGTEDLVGAVEGLLRLQEIYKLKSDDFSNGIIDGVKTRERLTAHDLFVIGEKSTHLENYKHFAREYLLLALDQMREGSDTDIDEDLLLDLLAAIHYQSAGYASAIENIRNHPNISNCDNLRNLSLCEMFSKADLTSELYERNQRFSQRKENILYSQVCRGSLTKSSKELAQLRCRYSSDNSYSLIGPFKIEEASLDPYIILIIDVVFDSEIDFLKNSSTRKLTRAKVYAQNSSLSQTSQRVAKVTTFLDQDHEIVARISKRLEVRTFYF